MFRFVSSVALYFRVPLLTLPCCLNLPFVLYILGQPLLRTRQPLANRNLFPGFGWAVGAFTAYVIYDDFFAKKSGGGHH